MLVKQLENKDNQQAYNGSFKINLKRTFSKKQIKEVNIMHIRFIKKT